MENYTCNCPAYDWVMQTVTVCHFDFVGLDKSKTMDIPGEVPLSVYYVMTAHLIQTMAHNWMLTKLKVISLIQLQLIQLS